MRYGDIDYKPPRRPLLYIGVVLGVILLAISVYGLVMFFLRSA